MSNPSADFTLPGLTRHSPPDKAAVAELPPGTLFFDDVRLERLLCRYGMSSPNDISSILDVEANQQRIALFESAMAGKEVFPNPEHIVYPDGKLRALKKSSAVERKKYKILNEGDLKQQLLHAMEHWMPDIRTHVQVYGCKIYWLPQEGFSIQSGSQVFPLSPADNLVESCRLLEIYLNRTMSPLEVGEVKKTLFPDIYKETASPELSEFLAGEI